MNGQLMELWGRTILAAFQGQSQLDLMTSWVQRACQDVTRMNATFLQFLGLPAMSSPQTELPNQWQEAWEPFLQFQQLSLRWIGMAPNNEYAANSKRIEKLEEQIKEHAHAIQKLQNLISLPGTGNNELVDQFQKLIDQQSQQFKQLTSSVGQYIQSSTNKVISKKNTAENED
jgi:DNA-binding ferritin-like protein (Dps family)